MNPRLQFMLEIIQKMGEFQRKHFGTTIQFEGKKSENDLVSFVDKESEKMFETALQEKFPNDTMMGEESYSPENDYKKYKQLWTVDPVDGTLMYQRGINTYGCMISYIENGVVQFSSILLPEVQDLFYADKNGAYKNSKKIRVSQINTLKDTILNYSPKRVKAYINDDKKMCNFLDETGHHLYFYSCASAFSILAEGKIDGGFFYPKYGNIWDTVPGGFLVQQAGGKVTNFGSDSWDIFNPNVIFSNGLIHAEFQKLLES